MVIEPYLAFNSGCPLWSPPTAALRAKIAVHVMQREESRASTDYKLHADEELSATHPLTGVGSTLTNKIVFVK